MMSEAATRTDTSDQLQMKATDLKSDCDGQATVNGGISIQEAMPIPITS